MRPNCKVHLEFRSSCPMHERKQENNPTCPNATFGLQRLPITTSTPPLGHQNGHIVDIVHEIRRDQIRSDEIRPRGMRPNAQRVWNFEAHTQCKNKSQSTQAGDSTASRISAQERLVNCPLTQPCKPDRHTHTAHQHHETS